MTEVHGDHSFITRLADAAPGQLRLAVKDCIDVVGVPTTVGCAVLAAHAVPAEADAACLAGARSAGACIVGKTNLHELCFGPSGVNPHFGTPINPLDPSRIPGGSSSGSAVAVAAGLADVALGTDTAGSVRNPAACCGIVGLKTTHGRVSLRGIWPLAPSMDTVGPMARDVAGVGVGMALLEPGFAPAVSGGEMPPVIGRIRGLEIDPAIDAAVDRALALAGLGHTDVVTEGWMEAHEAGRVVMFAEALQSDAELFPAHRNQLGSDVLARFETAKSFDADTVAGAYECQQRWRGELGALFGSFDALVLAGYPTFPPLVTQPDPASSVAAVAVSLAGNPSIVLPVAVLAEVDDQVPRTMQGEPFPASLQVVGPWGSEERLLALAGRIEAAQASVRS